MAETNLVAALRAYVEHRQTCDKWARDYHGNGIDIRDDIVCSCGLDALLASVPQQLAPVAHRLFEAIAIESGTRSEAEDMLLSAAGADADDPNTWPCGDVKFDDYDGSFEFKGTKNGWHPTDETIAAWWALGFSRCWICYEDGTEVYFAADGMRGARKRSVLASVPHEDAWHDIATAPKDGTWILVHGAGWEDLNQVEIAKWARGGWATQWGDELGGVTHWMPLPAPPVPEKEGR